MSGETFYKIFCYGSLILGFILFVSCFALKLGDRFASRFIVIALKIIFLLVGVGLLLIGGWLLFLLPHINFV